MRLRRTPRPNPYVAFDALLGWDATVDTTTEKKPSKIAAAAKAVVASTALGLLAATAALPLVGSSAITVNAAADYWENMPGDLPTQPLPQRSVILAADGSKIATFYSENRVLVSLDQVPPHLIDALVATEDARFYDHSGFEVRGTSRALVNNAMTDGIQGGSTLTQQYVKQVLLDNATSTTERAQVTSRTSYERKLREAKYAIELEKRLSKDQILEGYLNIAYFGDGAYGIGAAAKHYFNKDVTDLTIPESALLVGLVKNPSGYDPTDNLDGARDRRNTVLWRMRQEGHLSVGQYETFTRTKVRLDVTTPANGCTTSKYPFFCQWVKQTLENDPAFGETAEARQQRLFRGGMTIRTTLDPHAQDTAQAAVDRALGRTNRVTAAAVTVQPGTGHVTAMAINRGFGKGEGKTEILLPVTPAFQPGSTFKPFTLAAALEQGYDLSTVYNAPYAGYKPTGFAYPSDGFANSTSSGSGPLTAAQALWRSSNTWFVNLQTQVGTLKVADMAQRLGITSLPRTGDRAITAGDAALTLGVHEVSPLQMAGAYATFAAHGQHCTPVGITSITGPTGHPIDIPSANCHQAIPSGVADTMAAIMQGAIDGPDPARTGKAMSLGRPAAGKTGTTQNNAAVWFAGYTPQFATAVWVGDPRGGFAYPLHGIYAYGSYVPRAYGGLVAGPIWKEIMTGVHRDLPKKKFAPADPTTVTGFTNITPDVRGLPVDQAYRVLTRAGFTVRIAKTTAAPDPLLTEGHVHTTAPAPGTLTRYHGTVRLTLTAGSDTTVATPAPTPLRPDTGEEPTLEAGGPVGGRLDHGGGIVTPAPGNDPATTP